MYTLFRLALIGLAFAIPGCNSGGSEPPRATTAPPTSPQPPAPPPPPSLAWVSCADQPAAAEPSLVVATASPGGIGGGTLTTDTRRTTNWVEAHIGEDGRFHVSTYDGYTDGTLLQFAGLLDSAGNTFAGTGRAYMTAGDAPFENKYSGELEITGVIVERERFTAQWTAASGDSGCIDATTYFGYEYEHPLPGGVPARTWTSYQRPNLALTTDDDGSFSGQGSDGCTVNGRLTEIDERYGLYAAGLNISGCATAGDYAGLAYVCQSCGMAPVDLGLLLFIDNGVRAIRRYLTN